MPQIVTNGKLLSDVPDSEHKFGEAKKHHYLWVKDPSSGEEYAIGFTDKSLAAARKIAVRNSKDVPAKNWLIDLID